MMPTLHDQDRMIVSKLSYEIGQPKRFDIIVFHAPEGKDYIKRVIGLPGDRIEYKNDTLYVNGKAYKEPYLAEYKKQLVDGPLTDPFTLKKKLAGKQCQKVNCLLWETIDASAKIAGILEPFQWAKWLGKRVLSTGR